MRRAGCLAERAYWVTPCALALIKHRIAPRDFGDTPAVGSSRGWDSSIAAAGTARAELPVGVVAPAEYLAVCYGAGMVCACRYSSRLVLLAKSVDSIDVFDWSWRGVCGDIGGGALPDLSIAICAPALQVATSERAAVG